MPCYITMQDMYDEFYLEMKDIYVSMPAEVCIYYIYNNN